MLVAEVAVAECAVADDALSCILALLEVATGFAGRHDVFVWGVLGERVENCSMCWELVAENSEEKTLLISRVEGYIKDGWQCWSAKEGEGREVA